jgi:hypothetical protein
MRIKTALPAIIGTAFCVFYLVFLLLPSDISLDPSAINVFLIVSRLALLFCIVQLGIFCWDRIKSRTEKAKADLER